MMESQASQPAQARARPDYLDRIQTVLNTIIRAGGLELQVSVSKTPASPHDPEAPEWAIGFSGLDADLVLESHAALLDALASIACKAARVDEELSRRISFDCQGYRSARISELRLMAEMAAERVRETQQPFALSPMNSAERRVIHLAVRDQPQVRTESEGLGPARKVIIHPVKWN